MAKRKTKKKIQKKSSKNLLQGLKRWQIVLGVIALVLIVFLGIHAINGAMPAAVKKDIAQSKVLLQKDPMLGHYQLAVDYLRGGRIFKTLGQLNKVNRNAKKQYITQKDLIQKGLAFYEEQVETQPTAANQYYFAMTLIAGEDPSRAYTITNRIIAENNKDSFAYALRGVIYGKYLGSPNSALRDLQRAVELNPKPALYQYLLYEAYKTVGDNKNSAKALKSALWKLLWGF